jgi:hypothetical protein
MAHVRGLTHARPRRHDKAAPCPNCKAFDLVTIDGQWGITCQHCDHHLEPEEYDQHATAYLHAHQAATTNDDAAA